MLDFRQGRRKRGFAALPQDAGETGLFWMLVVVVALGALVFASMVGNGPGPDNTRVPQGLLVQPEPAGAGD